MIDTGYTFGSGVVHKPLETNGMSYILHAHQLCMKGYASLFDGHPSTVWSAPNYSYLNKSLCIVDQGMFALREIDRMEREMCSYLERQLNVEPSALEKFESMVQEGLRRSGSLPHSLYPPSSFFGPVRTSETKHQ